MDPVSLTFAALAAAGSLIKGFMGSSASQLAARIAQGNAALLEKQAEIERLQVDVAFSKGTYEQTRLSDKVTRVLAAQPGTFAASGLSSTAPTAVTAAGFTAQQGEADLEIVRANTALEAAAASTRVANTRGRAASASYEQSALEQRATADRIAGYFGAGTAFLSAGKGAFNGGGAAGDPLNLAAPGFSNPAGRVGQILAPTNNLGFTGIY